MGTPNLPVRKFAQLPRRSNPSAWNLEMDIVAAALSPYLTHLAMLEWTPELLKEYLPLGMGGLPGSFPPDKIQHSWHCPPELQEPYYRSMSGDAGM